MLASQERYYEQLDRANNSFSTRRVPCYMAAYAIDSMLVDGRWSARTFRFAAMGARWYLKLSCRGHATPPTDSRPQGGRLVTCRVRKRIDAETNRGKTRNLAGGTIRWSTAFTG